MKVRPSVKPMCEKCKIIKRKAKLWSFARTLSISRDKVKKEARKKYGKNFRR